VFIGNLGLLKKKVGHRRSKCTQKHGLHVSEPSHPTIFALLNRKHRVWQCGTFFRPGSRGNSSEPLSFFLLTEGLRIWCNGKHVRRSRSVAVRKKLRQSGGTHADEIETSMMLYIAPESVRMNKAARDLNPNQPGGLTRDPHGKGTYSPTGAWGDPTLATREKGRAVVESIVANILKEIDDLRQTK